MSWPKTASPRSSTRKRPELGSLAKTAGAQRPALPRSHAEIARNVVPSRARCADLAGRPAVEVGGPSGCGGQSTSIRVSGSRRAGRTGAPKRRPWLRCIALAPAVLARKASISRNRAGLFSHAPEPVRETLRAVPALRSRTSSRVGGQNCANNLGPFRDHDAPGAHLVKAGLFLVARAEPEKIAMIDLAGPRYIAMHQPIGRARHRFRDAKRG